MNPDKWLEEEVRRIHASFDPAQWSGDRREIESAFDQLEIEVKKQHRRDLETFVQGYDERELQTRTSVQVEALTKRINTTHNVDQQFGAQEAIIQLKNGARRDMAQDTAYQQWRSNVQAARANEQAEELKLINDATALTLKANGFEPHMEQAPSREAPAANPFFSQIIDRKTYVAAAGQTRTRERDDELEP